MDYGYPEKRKSKNDSRAKRRFNKYKQGGSSRTSNIQISNDRKSESKNC
ncbi:MAG: hypothetical protein Q8Q31_01335 [Nanoarchaeota archaeon]|nr:hypothetical protein [Nanoarchaeota archaeon]